MTDPGSFRSGVTLMEVIIAIGVILGGLVGIASLIPVAGRNAQATIEMDRGTSEAAAAAAKGVIRSFNDLDSLVIWDKGVFGSDYDSAAIPVPGRAPYAPTNMLRTIGWKIDGQTNMDPPIGGAAPVVLLGKLESPGYAHMPLGSGLSSGICIDPFGMPDLNLARSDNPTPNSGYISGPNSPIPFNGLDNTDSSFNYSRFPYYNERYSPVIPPNEGIGNPPPWSMAPRMWRATLKSPMYASSLQTAAVPVRSHQLLSAVAARTIFRSSGGLSPFGESSDNAPRSMLFSQTNIGGSFVDASRDASSDYTWFATLVPPFLGGNTFRQSIVIVRQRLAPVPRRQNDPLSLQKTEYIIDPDNPEENPSAERLAWIDPSTAIGFNGGTGGDVVMYGSQSVSDDIVVSEWVMLSRQPHVETPVGSGAWVPTGPAVHRWYRVLRVGDAEKFATDPLGGSNAVWRRRITLAGPDWAFQDTNTTVADDTYCTIVSGAVSVMESEVVIQ